MKHFPKARHLVNTIGCGPLVFALAVWLLLGGSISVFGQNKPAELSNGALVLLEDKVQNLDQKLEKISDGFREHKADESVKLEDLRQDLKATKGELEGLKFEFENFKNEQNQIRKDFDIRLLELEKKLQSSNNSASYGTAEEEKTAKETRENANTNLNSVKPKSIETIASEWKLKKNSTATIADYKQFIASHSGSSQLPDAYFQLGQVYFAAKNYKSSIQAFDDVVNKYPKSDRVCAALLGQGDGFRALKQNEEAVLFYQEVLSRCKNRPESKSAAKWSKLLAKSNKQK